MQDRVEPRAKAKPGFWYVALNVLLTGIMLASLMVDALDLGSYLADPSSYPIGSEAAGFRYATAESFIRVTVCCILICVAGLVLPFLAKDRSTRIVIRLSGATAAILATLTLALSVE